MIVKLFVSISLFMLIFSYILSLDSFKDWRSLVLSLFPFVKFESGILSGRLFTKNELEKFSGQDGSPVYLAILGDVFDVTSGNKHYGEGGGYHFFAGKDGTRAYVSGKFTAEGLVEDTSGLSHADLLGIEEWNNFYKKQYTFIGRLVGHFYDEAGQETAALKDFQRRLNEAKSAKSSDEDDKRRFPPCNFEYKQGQGRRIWCSTLSGGVLRSWAGYPRQYFQPGKTDPRCACVKESGAPSGSEPLSEHDNRGDLDNPLMKLYEGCHPESYECRFTE